MKINLTSDADAKRAIAEAKNIEDMEFEVHKVQFNNLFVVAGCGVATNHKFVALGSTSTGLYLFNSSDAAESFKQGLEQEQQRRKAEREEQLGDQS